MNVDKPLKMSRSRPPVAVVLVCFQLEGALHIVPDVKQAKRQRHVQGIVERNRVLKWTVAATVTAIANWLAPDSRDLLCFCMYSSSVASVSRPCSM